MSFSQYIDAETGFQYLRARYYDPATGQFLTRDPIEAETRSAYGYVGGNPLNATDPSGLFGIPNPIKIAVNVAVHVGRGIARGFSSKPNPRAGTPPTGTTTTTRPELNWVIRGGSCTLEQFEKQPVDADGYLTELSVQSFPGRTQRELSQPIARYGSVGITTSELLTAIGARFPLTHFPVTPIMPSCQASPRLRHLRYSIPPFGIQAAEMILSPSGGLWSPPIWVDFMHVDWNGCIPLDFPGTVQDLSSWKIEVVEGVRLLLYQEDANFDGELDDLVAVGTATYDEEEGRWVAQDWEPTPHVSELDLQAQTLYKDARSKMQQP